MKRILFVVLSLTLILLSLSTLSFTEISQISHVSPALNKAKILTESYAVFDNEEDARVARDYNPCPYGGYCDFALAYTTEDNKVAPFPSIKAYCYEYDLFQWRACSKCRFAIGSFMGRMTKPHDMVYGIHYPAPSELACRVCGYNDPGTQIR